MLFLTFFIQQDFKCSTEECLRVDYYTKMIIDFVSGLYLTLTRKEVEEINVICGQIAATFEH